jgi:hypothetical protein
MDFWHRNKEEKNRIPYRKYRKRIEKAILCSTIWKVSGRKNGLYVVNLRKIISGSCLLLLFKFKLFLFEKKINEEKISPLRQFLSTSIN